MFNIRLAGDHLYGKWLFTWLSLVMSLMMSYFVLSFFPRDVLDEIWTELSQFLRIFLTYSSTKKIEDAENSKRLLKLPKDQLNYIKI